MIDDFETMEDRLARGDGLPCDVEVLLFDGRRMRGRLNRSHEGRWEMFPATPAAGQLSFEANEVRRVILY
jgi:hypothetical protein